VHIALALGGPGARSVIRFRAAAAVAYGDHMQPKISSLADRPDMLERVVGMADSWPEFVIQDLVGAAHFPRIATELPEYVLFAEDEQGEVVANAFSVPFALGTEHRGRLPANGWDAVLIWAFSDLRRGVRPDTVSAISVSVAPQAQGRGLSGVMLSAMRDNARARGFREVVAPVRPNAKHLEPHTPMEEYAHRVRPDGLPQDPWLRVHARAGATFDTDGDIEVPGGLVPVRCEPARGYAVYVEPNVWMRHPL
jgi:GNAT superfamily N-acetyltransferase